MNKERIIAELWYIENRFPKLQEKKVKEIKQKVRQLEDKIKGINREIEKNEKKPNLSFYKNTAKTANELDQLITQLNTLQEMKADIKPDIENAREFIEENIEMEGEN